MEAGGKLKWVGLDSVVVLVPFLEALVLIFHHRPLGQAEEARPEAPALRKLMTAETAKPMISRREESDGKREATSSGPTRQAESSSSEPRQDAWGS